MFGDNMIDGYAEGEEPLVFYHKNGEYRQYESKQYRDLATGENQPKKGLFRVLVNTKGNRLMLVTVCMCAALVFMVSLLARSPNEDVVGSVVCSLSAISMEDEVIVSIKLTPYSQKKESENAPCTLNASIVAYNKDGLPIENAEISYKYDPVAEKNGAYMRYKFDNLDVINGFDISKIECDVSNGEVQKKLKCGIEKH